MSSDPREVKAQRWLSEQIEQLKALRTSNVRDTEFKQWRQSTLTIIQRIWPGEGKRSARFRRIPFSPPSSQAPLREIREYYERGCAEAAQLLKTLLEEVLEEGVPEPAEQARPASMDPGVAEDDFPTLDLPGGPEKPVKAAPKDAAEDAGGARPGAVSVRGDGRHADDTRRRNGSERRKKQSKNGSRRRLRDMLGLDALEKLGKSAPQGSPDHELDLEPESARADEEERASTPDEAPERTPPRGEQMDEPVAEAGAAESSGDAPAAEPADPRSAEPESEPESAEPKPSAPARASAAAEETQPESEVDTEEGRNADVDEDADIVASTDEEQQEGVPFTADEFLSALPIFKTEGKPVRRANRDAPPPEPIEGDFSPVPLTSGTAIAVAAIAAEVARLGVPEGQRARTRATLVNLAQLVEEGALDWEGLRTAVAFAMEHPPIGRRLLPLLIPFLDEAA